MGAKLIRWSTATEFIFYLGVLGQVAYMADPSKQVTAVHDSCYADLHSPSWFFCAPAINLKQSFE